VEPYWPFLVLESKNNLFCNKQMFEINERLDDFYGMGVDFMLKSRKQKTVAFERCNFDLKVFISNLLNSKRSFKYYRDYSLFFYKLADVTAARIIEMEKTLENYLKLSFTIQNYAEYCESNILNLQAESELYLKLSKGLYSCYVKGLLEPLLRAKLESLSLIDLDAQLKSKSELPICFSESEHGVFKLKNIALTESEYRIASFIVSAVSNWPETSNLNIYKEKILNILDTEFLNKDVFVQNLMYVVSLYLRCDEVLKSSFFLHYNRIFFELSLQERFDILLSCPNDLLANTFLLPILELE